MIDIAGVFVLLMALGMFRYIAIVLDNLKDSKDLCIVIILFPLMIVLSGASGIAIILDMLGLYENSINKGK